MGQAGSSAAQYLELQDLIRSLPAEAQERLKSEEFIAECDRERRRAGGGGDLDATQAYYAVQRVVESHNEYARNNPGLGRCTMPTFNDIREWVEYEFDKEGSGRVQKEDFAEMVKTILVSSILLELESAQPDAPELPEPGGSMGCWAWLCCLQHTLEPEAHSQLQGTAIEMQTRVLGAVLEPNHDSDEELLDQRRAGGPDDPPGGLRRGGPLQQTNSPLQQTGLMTDFQGVSDGQPTALRLGKPLEIQEAISNVIT